MCPVRRKEANSLLKGPTQRLLILISRLSLSMFILYLKDGIKRVPTLFSFGIDSVTQINQQFTSCGERFL